MSIWLGASCPYLTVSQWQETWGMTDGLTQTADILVTVHSHWNSPVPLWLTHTEHFHTPNPLTADQSCSNCCLCVLFLPSVSVLFSAQCQKASLLTVLWIVEPVVAQIKQCSTFTFSLCVCKVWSLTDRVELLQASELQGVFFYQTCWQVQLILRAKTPRTGNKMTSVWDEQADCSGSSEAQVLTFVSVC